MFEVLLGVSKREALNNFAIFNRGSVSGNTLPSDKYSFVDDVVSASTVLAAGDLQRRVGVSGPNFGLFAGGTGSLAVEKYAYSTAVVSSGTSLSVARYSASGAGNAVFGLIAGGYANGNYTNMNERYIYSNNVRNSATALATVRGSLGAVGTVDSSYFAGGIQNSGSASTTSVNERYNHNNNTVFNSGALSVARQNIGAVGTKTNGYFVGGYSYPYPSPSIIHRTVDILAIASQIVRSSSSLPASQYQLMGAGNSDLGIFSGGVTSSAAVASGFKLNYATETFSSATSLRYARSSHAAISGNSGGF